MRQSVSTAYKVHVSLIEVIGEPDVSLPLRLSRRSGLLSRHLISLSPNPLLRSPSSSFCVPSFRFSTRHRPVRIPYLQLQMPYPKFRMRHLQHRMPHSKLQTRRFKHRIPRLTFQVPHPRFQTRHLKHRTPYLKLQMSRSKHRMLHLMLQMPHSMFRIRHSKWQKTRLKQGVSGLESGERRNLLRQISIKGRIKAH